MLAGSVFRRRTCIIVYSVVYSAYVSMCICVDVHTSDVLMC